MMCAFWIIFSGDFFFFSSRRRHTRCYRDWSSDVCSSDLGFFSVPIHKKRKERNELREFLNELTDYIDVGIRPDLVSLYLLELRVPFYFLDFLQVGIEYEPVFTVHIIV